MTMSVTMPLPTLTQVVGSHGGPPRNGRPRLVLVDDQPTVLNSLERILHADRNGWDAEFFSDSVQAWQRLQAGDVDVLICDLNMPRMTGLELLARIRGTPQSEDVQVIVLTGMADRSLKRAALDLGATDLLNKPIDAEDLLARIRNALRLKAYADALKAINCSLEAAVQRRTEQLHESRLAIVWRLAKAAEFRDEDTGNHVIRVGCYARLMGESLRLASDFVENLFLAAPLHDIGKIGIPDGILLKPGPLTPDEWQVMKQHCLIGKKILEDDAKTTATFRAWRQAKQTAGLTEDSNPVLKLAASIAWSHHEKWNGSGYPLGLSGETIPLASRIVAFADVFDALTSARPYKKAFPEDEAIEIIRSDVGRHFDPNIHRAFEASLAAIRDVRAALSDEPIAAPPKSSDVTPAA
jgi:putative two-component system response regulator